MSEAKADERRILEWMVRDKTGASSMSMARAALGIDEPRVSHPHDPDDLIRCLDFCDDTGVSPEIMRGKSDAWDKLIGIWTALRGSLADDLGRTAGVLGIPFSWDAKRTHGKSARRTYDMINVKP